VMWGNRNHNTGSR